MTNRKVPKECRFRQVRIIRVCLYSLKIEIRNVFFIGTNPFLNKNIIKIKIAYITYENKDSFIDVELKDDKIILLANGEKINNINK